MNIHPIYPVRRLACLLVLLAVACNLPAPEIPQTTPTTIVPASPPATQIPTREPGPTSIPSLGSLGQARGIWIGTAVFAAGLNDPAYTALLEREFRLVTPEVEMKFEVIHPEPDRYDFSGSDAIVTFAQERGMLVRGHTLVWDLQIPDWVLEGDYTQEEWKTILREHITTVVSRYRGRVVVWDVVNEALNDDGTLRDTFWLRAIGPEHIAMAFRWAHEADPEARLFYNDNGAEGMNTKSDAVYALVQGLLEAGVPVHGVGLQMHTALGSLPPQSELDANLERLGKLGLEVHITEMDVRLQYSRASDEEKLARQAEHYRSVLTACLGARSCSAFVTWGLTDRYSWIPGFTGSPDAPLLFDEEGQPKPAYDALLAELGP